MEDLLKEKDNQVDMARARLTAMQAHHCSSEGALTSLEEAIGDRDKQMQMLRDQRDRAEQDKQEERELHERELAEYKMKLRAFESDVEKLNIRLDRALTEKERLETRLESSQSELGKSKAELDRAAHDVSWDKSIRFHSLTLILLPIIDQIDNSHLYFHSLSVSVCVCVPHTHQNNSPITIRPICIQINCIHSKLSVASKSAFLQHLNDGCCAIVPLWANLDDFEWG